MKRCRFGISLLILLLILSICVTGLMDRFHSPLSSILEQAALCAETARWEDAAHYASCARNRWERYRKFSAALADHEPMEDIDRLFSELDIWLQAKEAEHCASICAQLSQSAEAMRDAHTLTWWNLL